MRNFLEVAALAFCAHASMAFGCSLDSAGCIHALRGLNCNQALHVAPNISLKRTNQSLRDLCGRLAHTLGPLGRGLGSIPPAPPNITRPTAEAGGALAVAKRRAVPRSISSRAQARDSSQASAKHLARLISASRGRACRSVGQAVAFWPNYSLKRTDQSLRD